MDLSLNNLGTPRPPFVAALIVTLIFGGTIVLEQNGLVTLPMPSDELIASILPGAVVTLTNEERADRDLGNLRANALLTRAAQMKADDMAARSYYAHVSPDGTVPPYWLNKVGYKYQIMGENLVIDREDSDQVVSAWMGSPTHRENLLNPQFTEIGIGVAHGRYQGRKTIYVVQMLARPLTVAEPAPRPTPAPAPAAPAPTPRPVPSPALPRADSTPPLVRPPAPEPVVRDTIAPVLETIASSTLIELPSIVATSSYQQPALSATVGEPVPLAPAAPAPEARTPIREKVSAFLGGVTESIKNFFDPIF